MKKFWTILLLLISGIFIFSCKDDDDNYVSTPTPYVDNDTIATVYDYTGNFSFDTTNGWNFYRTLPSSLVVYDSDVMLIYQKTGTTTDNYPIWQSIPATYYPVVGGVSQQVYYDYDFSVHDFMIYAQGSYDLTATPQYLNNQTFRIVMVPGAYGLGGKTANDLKNLSYEEVIKKFHIDDSHVKSL